MNSTAMSLKPTTDLHQVSDRLSFSAMRNWKERLIEAVLLAAAAVSVLTTLGIVYVLLSESVRFFATVSLVDFLTDTQWTPLFDDAHFGIMVLVSGTLVSSLVALAVAVPMGTVIAIYLSSEPIQVVVTLDESRHAIHSDFIIMNFNNGVKNKIFIV